MASQSSKAGSICRQSRGPLVLKLQAAVLVWLQYRGSWTAGRHAEQAMWAACKEAGGLDAVTRALQAALQAQENNGDASAGSNRSMLHAHEHHHQTSGSLVGSCPTAWPEQGAAAAPVLGHAASQTTMAALSAPLVSLGGGSRECMDSNLPDRMSTMLHSFVQDSVPARTSLQGQGSSAPQGPCSHLTSDLALASWQLSHCTGQ